MRLLALLLAVTPPDPHALVDGAIAAMQRNTSLGDIRSVRLAGAQHDWILGNAERAEGPWRVGYSQFSELHDIRNASLRRTAQSVLPTGAKSADRITILVDSVVANRTGNREIGASKSFYEDVIDRVDGSPIRALLLASRSPALKYERVVKHYGVTFDVVSFPWRNGRMELELNRDSHLPGAVEIVRPYSDNFRWAPFGDVHMRADYVDWNVQPSGAYWPMQVKVSLNGEPLRDVTFATVALDTAAPAADSFAVSDSARLQSVAASKLDFSRFRLGMRGQPTELEPGIVRVPDQWTQTLVRQPDGVVIFEAHISGQYLMDVIGEAHKRWPGAPIKALVMTSDPWAHLGGVRQAMALGIPIYVSSGSVPFLTALAKMPHTMEPDSLAKVPRAPKFIPVVGKTVIGRGENQIELYPVGGEYGERMLMAYFPGHKVLYGADLVFPNRGPDGKVDKGFFETSAVDLRRAVAREKLAVDSLFCVQASPIMAWDAFSVTP
ncbi:MAG: hypothetical protein JWM41_1346 [Gemmatimonadetes bacterium]|nr:hypothetical protein [Gemmatimonadota bacterium]